jgi:Phosphorylase superfamily
VTRVPLYARPQESSDLLYADDRATDPIPHPDLALTGHRPGRPKVHYGLIASGDRSLRSARKRDEIAAAHDVLAIEMEGKGLGYAGFSVGVEWLVIRGISDYGDAHVTRDWRRYASLAAAGYSRALLAECPPLASQAPPEPGASAAVDGAGQHVRPGQDAPGAGGSETPGRVRASASGRGVVIGGSNSGVISTSDHATIEQHQ